MGDYNKMYAYMPIYIYIYVYLTLLNSFDKMSCAADNIITYAKLLVNPKNQYAVRFLHFSFCAEA